MPLSGFPELLPAQRAVEQTVLDRLRRVFELHGFASLETPAAESLDQLLRKGEIDKEVYVLRRLHADASDGEDSSAGLGLHFDLTVPFARYVLEHAGHLEFPFRRYQIQKVWRGERPQEGRYREFTQADIDIVAKDELPFHHDVEIARVMAEALGALDFLPPLRLQVNNRRLIEGFYRGLGAPDPAAVMRVIDKLDKVAARRDRGAADRAKPGSTSGRPGCACSSPRSPVRTPSFVARVRELGVEHELLDTGLAELAAVLDGCADLDRARVDVSADLRIARGPGLLHRHRVRDADDRVRLARLDLLRRALRLAGLRRADHLPRRRHLARRHPPAAAAVPAHRAQRVAGGAVGGPGGAAGRVRAGRQHGDRPSAAGAGHRGRGRAPRRRSTAGRSATPSGAASRSSGSPAPTPRRRTASGTSAAASRWRPTRASGHRRTTTFIRP